MKTQTNTPSLQNAAQSTLYVNMEQEMERNKRKELT
jgi:hypothetical protein